MKGLLIIVFASGTSWLQVLFRQRKHLSRRDAYNSCTYTHLSYNGVVFNYVGDIFGLLYE